MPGKVPVGVKTSKKAVWGFSVKSLRGPHLTDRQKKKPHPSNISLLPQLTTPLSVSSGDYTLAGKYGVRSVAKYGTVNKVAK